MTGNEQLLFLTGDDYAHAFHAAFGWWPRYAPTDGDYYTGRKWAMWAHV